MRRFIHERAFVAIGHSASPTTRTASRFGALVDAHARLMRRTKTAAEANCRSDVGQTVGFHFSQPDILGIFI
jgi:hypothetical protein